MDTLMDTLIESAKPVPDAPTVELLEDPFGMIQQGLVISLTNPKDIIENWMTQKNGVVQALSRELLQNPKQLSQKLDLIEQWVDHTVAQILELDSVMSHLKENTKTTTVRGSLPLHRGHEPLDWTFVLFRIEEQTIQDMTWQAFLKQVELYTILFAFAWNRAPIIQPDPSTRVADIQECRDKWGVLNLKLTGIRRTSKDMEQ